MYYVYLLKSLQDEGYYIGYSDDLKKRFTEHQKGKVDATKNRRPLELFYYEAYSDKLAAQTREHKLKQFGSSYNGLIKRIV
jgi:putative endonuclease